MQGHALGVDLGTSNTVAVLSWPDGRTRPLLFDGQPLLPSGVLLDESGRLHVGHDARRLAQADPGRYEPNPKRHVDTPGVLLGDREVATVDLLAAVLAAVAHAAVEAVGYLPPATLTYPAAWGPQRRQILTDALARAGWPAGTTLAPEPVAAARYFAEVLRRPVPVGSALAVFDFGGGTVDIAVVRNDGPDPAGRARFSVVAAGGVAELGGLDLDAALVDHLGHTVAGSDPAAWERLRHPANAAQWRDRRRFWDDVRGAKEMLSRAAVAPVAVPGVEKAVHLTRDELERLATPLLRRAVMETAAVIAAANLRPDQLAGLFLVGGSSRVPLVARMLHADLGVAPTVLEQPELPVAEGALAELPARAAHIPAQAAAPVPTAVPVSGVPTSLPPTSLPPTSPAPSSPTPTSPSAPPPAGPWSPPPGGPPAAAPSRRVPRKLLISAAAAAVVVVVAAVTAVIMLNGRAGYEKVKFAAFSDVGQPLPAAGRFYYAWTHVRGDRAYLAYQTDDKKLTVVAADATNGKQVWSADVPETPDSWKGIRAVPGAILAYTDSFSSTVPDKAFVLDPDNGRVMWSFDLFYGDDQVFVAGDRLVIVDAKNHLMVGYGLRDGARKWEQPAPKGDYDDFTTAVIGVQSPDDVTGPADFTGVALDPDRADDAGLVQLGADRSVRVIDVATGGIRKQRTAVAGPDDLATAYDGQLFTAKKSDTTELFAVDVETLDKPRLIYRADDPKRRPVAVSACGDKRICLLDQTDSKNTELISVPLDGKGETWKRPAVGAESILPVGSHVLLQTGGSSEPRVTGFDASGKQVLDQAGFAARVNGSSVLVFPQEPTSSSVVDDYNVVGWVLGEKAPVQLGALQGVRLGTCTWTTAVIACAGDADLRLRRFAG
ncbi:Hsp70 family protein [Asanoa sp. NPDC050611]|uniref:Hsp70 family protein n=1 Tax=Asanoa sp. NPDC050611 TaxID=3157098 RepID=UPI0033E43EF9